MIVPYEPEPLSKRGKIIFYSIIIVVGIFLFGSFITAVFQSQTEIAPNITGIPAFLEPIPYILLIGTIIAIGVGLAAYYKTSDRPTGSYYIDEVGDYPNHYQVLEKDVL
jgi:uncharacterized BrkB/YihY/UPF0761 family membrane protein